jgi:hypothetical protein
MLTVIFPKPLLPSSYVSRPKRLSPMANATEPLPRLNLLAIRCIFLSKGKAHMKTTITEGQSQNVPSYIGRKIEPWRLLEKRNRPLNNFPRIFVLEA